MWPESVTTERVASGGARLLVGILAAVVAAGCIEGPLTGLDSGDAPGKSSATVEFVVPASRLPGWRDTTYTGYAIPVDAPFLFLNGGGDGSPFQARALVRYDDVPDSVPVEGEQLAVEEYRETEIRLAVDTVTAQLPVQEVTFRVFTLTRRFAPSAATWNLAREGVPWDSAGGDLGRELAAFTLTDASLTTLADTVRIPFGSVSDSILRVWEASEGEPGAIVMIDEEDVELRIESASLHFDAKPVDRDTLVRFGVGNFLRFVPSTFIYSPRQPDPGHDLRVGGLPANRFYFGFRPPDSIQGHRLRGGTINGAELLFRPRASPPTGFRPQEALSSALVELGADPFELGPKTPVIGTVSPGPVRIRADSLEAGKVLRMDVTGLLRQWAMADPDTLDPFRLGVRLLPDNQSVAFWDFGSVAADTTMQPALRVIFTPPVSFDSP